jgi:hypothetical protein
MSRARKGGFFGLFGGKRTEAETLNPATNSKATQQYRTSAAQASALGQSETVYEVALDGSPLPNVVNPANLNVEVVSTPDGRRVARLSGGDPATESSGRTGGYSIRVPDSFETAVSGKRVRVTVVARAAGGGSAEFAVAYSTAEVGNSGWRKQTVGDQFESRAFEWDVPPMINGYGDYVGILAPAGSNGIDVAAVKVEALSRV